MRPQVELSEFGKLIVGKLPEGVSRAKLAREADMDYAYLHLLLTGKRGAPSVDMLNKIVDALVALGAVLTKHDQQVIMNAAIKVPDGWVVKKEMEPVQEIVYQPILDDLEVAAQNNLLDEAALRRIQKQVQMEIEESASRQGRTIEMPDEFNRA